LATCQGTPEEIRTKLADLQCAKLALIELVGHRCRSRATPIGDDIT
jgi:hypothetical protein